MVKRVIWIILATLIGWPVCLFAAVQFGIINLDPRHGSRRFNPPSIEIARSQRLLVSQPILSTPVMQWKGVKYSISQVWIDHLVDEDVFFRRSVSGHRLKIQVENFDTRIGVSSFGNTHMVCNQTIEFRSTLQEAYKTTVWVADVSKPLPASLSCEIRASQ